MLTISASKIEYGSEFDWPGDVDPCFVDKINYQVSAPEADK